VSGPAEHFWPPHPILAWAEAPDYKQVMIDHETLGPCCNCGSQEHVHNIVMLPRLAPVPGKGWGCAVCGLAMDGAVAVLCDRCVGDEPSAVCVGYPSAGQRMPIAELPETVFDHNHAIRH